MSLDSETVRFIRQEIERQVHIIYTGVSQNSKQHTEDILNYLPGSDPIPGRPLMQPFGFASVTPDDVLSVVARQGSHPLNLLTLGHRDKNKPGDLAAGESAQYSKGGYQVRVNNGKVQVGKNGTWQTLVMGEDLEAVLIALIAAIIAHQHIGNLGYPTSKPTNAADFQAISDTQVKDGKLLSKDGGKF